MKSVRHRIGAAALLLAAIGILAGSSLAQRHATGTTSRVAAGTKSIVTVSQGTSMAVALSPNGKTLCIDLQGSLWTLPRTGGKAKRITDDLYDARQPAWSPDGKRIAFQAYRSGTWDIWVIGADGAGAKTITPGPFDDREPHWSPDGRTIAFSSDRSGNYDIWTVDVATGAVRQVTKETRNDTWPAWSPDGREIAFVAATGPANEVHAATLDGHERTLGKGTGALGAPAWSPDGATVAFESLSGTTSSLLLGDHPLTANEDVTPFRPQWASSQTLIYTSDGLIRGRSINLNAGATAQTIRFTADLPVLRPTYAPMAHDFDGTTPRRALGLVRPSLSPDGTTLAFVALGDVWVSRRGEKPSRVTDDVAADADPSWSPDGKRLAYSSDRGESFDVYVRDIETGGETRLTSGPASELWPTWSHDGSKIAFVSVAGLTASEVFVVEANGASEPRRILTGQIGPMSPAWSLDDKTVFASALRTYSSKYREGVNQLLAVPVVETAPAGGALTAPPRPITLLDDITSAKGGEGPAWSPDFKWVAFVVGSVLNVMPVSPNGEPAGRPREIMTPGVPDQLSWSADSKMIVATENDNVVTIDAATGARKVWPVDLMYTRSIAQGEKVIHAGTLIDGVSNAARTNVDIVVTKNRITRIVPHSDAEHAREVVDASGLTVIPGLIEAHGHYAAEFGSVFDRAHLAYGITSVRSPGSKPFAMVEARETYESGRRLGPRLFGTGYLIDGTRVYYPMSAASPTEMAVDREVERARSLRFDLLKTYVRLPDALQRRAAEGAHAIGIPLSSHEVYPATASGMDSVEHLSATSRRGYSPKVSLLGRSYEDVVRVVSTSGMTLTPTLALSAARRAIGDDASTREDPRWQIFPAWVRAPYEAQRTGAATPAANTQSRDNMLAFFKAGVPILAGTDTPITPYGISLHIELEEYVAAGMTPLQAIQSATINVARVLHVEKDLGTIEAGKLADLVIVDGNPLENIRTARRVQKVVLGGIVHEVARH